MARELVLTHDEAAAIVGDPDPTRLPLTSTWSKAELAAMEELRDAGRQLEATYVAWQRAKEVHQQALGKLHRMWDAGNKPAGG